MTMHAAIHGRRGGDPREITTKTAICAQPLEKVKISGR
jgi:hypothetical protein